MDNLGVGDEVLVIGAPEPRGMWKTGLVSEVHPGRDGLVRAVTVTTDTGVLTRPITKVCLLKSVGNSSGGGGSGKGREDLRAKPV